MVAWRVDSGVGAQHTFAGLVGSQPCVEVSQHQQEVVAWDFCDLVVEGGVECILRGGCSGVSGGIGHNDGGGDEVAGLEAYLEDAAADCCIGRVAIPQLCSSRWVEQRTNPMHVLRGAARPDKAVAIGEACFARARVPHLLQAANGDAVLLEVLGQQGGEEVSVV
jgi:hypothetical protein